MNGRKALSVFGLCVAGLAVLGGLLTAILSYKMTHWIMQTQVTLGPDSQSEVRREGDVLYNVHVNNLLDNTFFSVRNSGQTFPLLYLLKCICSTCQTPKK